MYIYITSRAKNEDKYCDSTNPIACQKLKIKLNQSITNNS